MTTVKRPAAGAPVANTDTYAWSNPLGGDLMAPSNWMDINTGTVTAIAPGISNTVSITGGRELFLNIIGTSTAAQLTMANLVILWGEETVGGAITLGSGASASYSNVGLDGGAVLTAASLNLHPSSTLEVGGGSRLAITGNATLASADLSAMAGSSVQLGGFIDGNNNNPASMVSGLETIALTVDGNSSIEIGSAGGATLGAITIDKGQSVAFNGSLSGNVVVQGTLNVEGGASLLVGNGPPGDSSSAVKQTASLPALMVSGGGQIRLSEGSALELAAADSAAIQFTDPSGVLILDQFGQTGTISGFAATDAIETAFGLATGVSAAETTSKTTLTFTNGANAVGTLTLAGNYTNNRFHFSRNLAGTVTLQTIGSLPQAPSVITGTTGYDSLTATASNQTLIGLGGDDSMSAAGFTGVSFKDSSSNLNGATIDAFGTTDVIDLTDISTAKASVVASDVTSLYDTLNGSASLTVTDGTHNSTINLTNLGASPLSTTSATAPPGYFVLGTDGATGTDVRYVTVTPDAYSLNAQTTAAYANPGDWSDNTTGSPAAVPPSVGSAVTIAGSAVGFTTITGTGVAATLTTGGNVTINGTITEPGLVNTGANAAAALTQTGTLVLNSHASLALAATGPAGVVIGGSVTVGGNSKLTAANIGFTQDGAALWVTGTSTARFTAFSRPSPLPASFILQPGSGPPWATIGVDATSSIEFGTTGAAQQGAATIDAGVTADFSGAIAGNLVLNGTLVVASLSNVATLSIGGFNTPNASVTGTGTLAFGSQNQTLRLSGSDSAAIQFTTADILALGSIIPTGTISGFGAGDSITLARTVTGFQYTTSAGNRGSLILQNGSAAVGTLAFAGSYTPNQFGLQPGSGGVSSTLAYLPAAAVAAVAPISHSSLGIPAQPALIQGTKAADILTATAPGQTLTGLGGGDTLNGAGFTALTFKDLTANLNGSVLQHLAPGNVLDFTDMKSATASATYSAGTLTVSNGSVSASLVVGNFASSTSFHVGSDGAAGTKVTWS